MEMDKRFGQKVERVTVPCAVCGTLKELRVTDYARRATGKVFCSKECRDANGTKPRRGDIRHCITCGAEFYNRPRGNQVYCSKQCHDRGQCKGITIVCAYCDKLFESKPSYIKNGKKFCSRRCYGMASGKNALERWHNGKPAYTDKDGYVKVWQPDHFNAVKGWVLEHRLVVEQHLGRSLDTKEHVHHNNGDKTDNRLENLRVIGHIEHGKLSRTEQLQREADVREKLRLAEQELAVYRERFGPLTCFDPK